MFEQLQSEFDEQQSVINSLFERMSEMIKEEQADCEYVHKTDWTPPLVIILSGLIPLIAYLFI